MALLMAEALPKGDVGEEREAALVELDEEFLTLEQLNFTPAEHKAMANVLREAKVQAARGGANVEL